MKGVVTVFCCLCLAIPGFAQEIDSTPTEALEQRVQTIEESLKILQKLKITGYIQAQYQWGKQYASLKVGSKNNNPDESFGRIGIRRGRVKITYDEGIALGVFQLDMTEKGVGIKDAYFGIKDPFFGTNILRAGVFDRTFGNEISYSSSQRESPERSTIFQTLFPEERDLGVALTLQAAKTSPWNFLKLNTGLFAGNGIKEETDSHRDFIGHLSATKSIGSKAKWGLGTSYYSGRVFQGNENVYTMNGNVFVRNDTPNNKGEFAKREYIGFEGQFSVINILGLAQIRAEYLFGTQPATHLSSKSPNTSTPIIADTYIRNFSGGYVIFVQDLKQLPFSVVLKYDWYDPNSQTAKDDVGLNGTGATDLAQNTIGFGLLWRASNNIRLQAFYEINNNETSLNLPAFTEDVKNDVFTLRLQYKF